MSSKENLNRLVDRQQENKALQPAQEKESIPGTTGTATLSQASGSGSGIASPLSEIARKTQIVTVDVPFGAATVDIDVIVQLTMSDAVGREVVFNFEPPAA